MGENQHFYPFLKKSARFIYTTARIFLPSAQAKCTRRFTPHPTDIHIKACNVARLNVYISWVRCKPPCTCGLCFNLALSSSELVLHCTKKPGRNALFTNSGHARTTIQQEPFKGACTQLEHGSKGFLCQTLSPSLPHSFSPSLSSFPVPAPLLCWLFSAPRSQEACILNQLSPCPNPPSTKRHASSLCSSQTQTSQ